MAKHHAFRAFDEVSLQETCKGWEKDVEEGLAFPTDVQQLLGWTRAHSATAENEVAYGVFDVDDLVAVAICEIVVTRLSSRSKWVKMLRLRLKPSLEQELLASEAQATAKALEVFKIAFGGAFRLKKELDATTLKVYGRTDEQLRFLQVAATSASVIAKTHDTSVKGRFLVIENK